MGTFELPVKAVTAEVLERLRDERVKEGLQLEYKESLPIDKTRDKFLSSVTAFANSSSGDLIYGIKAKRDDEDAHTGEIEKVVGLPGINFDLETLRLQNWVRTCIEPRLLVTIEPIERGNEPACLLVRVPRSWTTPHLVTTIGNSFYGRHSGGKYQLSSNEIRQAFVIAATARDRVRDFRIDRVTRIQRDEVPTQVGSGPKLIFHCLPLNSDDNAWVRFREAERQGEEKGPPIGTKIGLIYGRVQTWNYNADGFLVSTLQTSNPYTQVFRDCGIEAVDISLKFTGLDSNDDVLRVYWGINIERNIIHALQRYQTFWNLIGLAGPISMSLTLLGVKGFSIVPGHVFRKDVVVFDRSILMSSDVVIDDLSIPADSALKPLFDFIWNASGYRESPHYTDGKWSDPS
jgi:hypothetical protein